MNNAGSLKGKVLYFDPSNMEAPIGFVDEPKVMGMDEPPVETDDQKIARELNPENFLPERFFQQIIELSGHSPAPGDFVQDFSITPEGSNKTAFPWRLGSIMLMGDKVMALLAMDFDPDYGEPVNDHRVLIIADGTTIVPLPVTLAARLFDLGILKIYNHRSTPLPTGAETEVPRR